MGFLKPKPRKRKVVKQDAVSKAQQVVRMLKGTSLTEVTITNPKLTIRIRR